VATEHDQKVGSVAASQRSGPGEDGRRFGRGELEPHTEEHLLDEFEGERPGRKLHGFPALVLSVLGGGLSLFAIYWVFEPMSAQQYRPIFLAVALLLTFMVFRGGQRRNRADHPEENPTAGDWYISLNGYAAYSGVTLKATYSGGGGGGGCTTYSGSLSGTGASAIQPNGTYYQTTVTGSHTGKLTGPSGVDFDLYLQKWNGSAWANVASGTGSTATENVTYSNGTAGYYQWKVVSYTGSGSYTLCISHP